MSQDTPLLDEAKYTTIEVLAMERKPWLTAKHAQSHCGMIGKQVAAEYRTRHGEEPETRKKFVGGEPRDVFHGSAKDWEWVTAMSQTRMRWAWFAVVLVFVCVRITLADSWDNAVAAYARGDYATALPIFRFYATDGHARAQYNLGVMYAIGLGVTQDYVAAHMWLNLAATQGHGAARKN